MGISYICSVGGNVKIMQKSLLLFGLFLCQNLFGQDNCDTLFSKADDAFQNYKFEEAITFFNKIIHQKCSDLLKAYNNRGTVYNYLEKYDKALNDFEEALKINSKNAMALANKAATFSYQKKYKEATELLNKSIAEAPNYYLFYKMRADILGSNNETDKAIADYEKCISLKSSYIDAYMGLAKFYRSIDNNSKEEETYNRLIKNNSDNPRLIIFRATFYRQTRQYSKAITDYLQAIKIDATEPETLYNVGYCYEMEGETDKAIDYYTKSIKQKESEIAYWARGYIYKKSGKLLSAISDMENNLRLDPENAQAYLVMGNSYLDLGNKQKAVECYKKGLSLNPKPSIKELLELQLVNAK
jgi:tetratricopeptide (TPR) repeat protein